MNKIIITVTAIIFSIGLITAQSESSLENWYHLDPQTDGFNGVSEIRTYKELLKDEKSERIIVAVIDSGVDKDHEDLKNIMWVNKDEIPENGIDDDNNGYIDDIHGWNFIGGKDGRNINAETLELTRLYNKLRGKYENVEVSKLNKKEKETYKTYQSYKSIINEELTKAKSQLENLSTMEKNILMFVDLLDQNIEGSIFSQIGLDSIQTEDQELTAAVNMGKRFIKQWEDSLSFNELKVIVKENFEEGITYYNNKINYNYNVDYNGRAEIVKDDISNYKETNYGNNDIEGPDALHGTHVAGIIGAERANDLGMDGIANNVSIMSVRTVPNGDERDKDVANAIRYAVDNGASIINMSFGKGHSWNKDIVDKAVRYAEKHDVLLVHAAGNSSQNNDLEPNFPNSNYDKIGCLFWKKKKAKNWIEIGALSYEKGLDLVAGFSNYGAESIDVFAPGVQIYATIPDNKYKYLQGTSMAAPVVAGMAAVLRSYFPSLTAVQVKDIIMKSTIKMDKEVYIPGLENETSTLSKMSVTGGVVNLYNAVKLAKKTKGKKKIKKKKKNNV